MVNPNIDVIKHALGRVIYSHKTHEKGKEVNEFIDNAIKWGNVVLVGTTAILSYLSLQNPTKYQLPTALFSAFSLMTLVAQLSFRPESQAERHRRTADKLWLMREKYLNLLTDMQVGMLSDKDVGKLRESLTLEVSMIYGDAPNTNSFYYRLAQNALKLKNEHNFTEDEINQFLPPSLKSNIN